MLKCWLQDPGLGGNMGQSKGYTLLELLIVMAILVILAVVSLPGMRDTIDRNARDSAMQQLMTALSTARAEAVNRGTPVSLCRSTNGSACAASSNGDWRSGWLVFVDAGTAGVVNANDTIVRVMPGISGNMAIRARTAANANVTGDYFRFDAEGFLIYPVGGGYMKICHADNTLSFARAIWVAKTGRGSYSLDDVDGIHNNMSGGNLVCP